MRKVYLDNNATTPLRPEVLEAMLPFYKDLFGNPSSVHQFGRSVKVKVEEARARLAALIGADPSEIVFTSGGSESDNFAIKGVAFGSKSGHIITSQIEHPAVLSTCKSLQKMGYSITYIPVDSFGMVDPDQARAAIRPDTLIISIHHANNEVGTIQPIEEIARIAHEKGIFFHTDAVQSLGKLPINVKKMDVDLLSVSAHKLNGPKGVGALYIRSGLKKMAPLIDGGHHERHRRAGTENAAGIVGFGKACEIAGAHLESEAARITSLRDRLYKNLSEKISHTALNGHPSKRLPTTLNMGFEFVEGESLLINLDLQGVAVSTGSACSSGSLEPSHVLTAMGIPHEKIHGSLRFSFGHDNTEEDVDYVSEILPPIVRRIREISPLWDGKD